MPALTQQRKRPFTAADRSNDEESNGNEVGIWQRARRCEAQAQKRAQTHNQVCRHELWIYDTYLLT